MYTFELNIGSYATPSVGGGWIAATPEFNKCTFSRKRGLDNLQIRDTLEGSLIFNGTQASALYSLRFSNYLTVGIRLKISGVVKLTGKLDLAGKYDTKANKAELKFSNDDQYNKVLANLNKEKSFTFSGWADTITVEYTTTQDKQGQEFEDGYSGSYEAPDAYYADNGSEQPNAWDSGTTYSQGNLVGDAADRRWGGDFDNCFVRHSGRNYVSKINNNLGNTPTGATDANWILLGDPPTNIQTYTQERGAFDFGSATYDETNDYWKKASTDTDTYSINQRAVKLFDVFEEMLSEIDSSIEIYETTSGANTGLCTYIEDNFSNLEYLFYYSFENSPKIKLQEILDIFKVLFRCEWTIKDNIFLFVHPSERPSAVGIDSYYNITTYLSKDWTRYEQEQDIQDKLKYERVAIGESSYEDFDVQELEYANEFQNTDEISLNIGTDYKRQYNSSDGRLLLAATTEDGGTTWDLYNQTGVNSGETEFNGGLAASKLITNFYLTYGTPFGSLTWNSGNYTPSQKRNRRVQFNLPIVDPTIFDFDYLIQTSIEQSGLSDLKLELLEVNVKLDGSMAEIIGVY